MVGTRSAQIPFEYVVAELAAAPLSLPGTMHLGITELDPRMQPATSGLWRATENALLSDFSAYSVDELTALRDWLWFSRDSSSRQQDSGAPVPLGDFLSRFSRDTLIFAGNSFRPRRPRWSEAWTQESGLTDDPLARRYWRWIAFALPPDLLIAAHPDHDDTVPNIDVVSPVVAQILLDEGYVEPHMHLGAALQFPMLWISLLHALSRSDEVQHDSFMSPGADLEEGRHMGTWLILAAIARYTLAAFLYHKESDGEPPQVFYQHRKKWDAQTPLKQRGGRGQFASGGPFDGHTSQLLDRALFNLEHGKLESGEFGKTASEAFKQLQNLYEKIAGIRYRWPEFPQRLLSAWQADPISGFFPVSNLQQRSSEIQFISAGMAYLKTETGRGDLGFARLFWQVVRIRCLFYRHIVQRPMTPGLQWFLRFYSRINAPRSVMSSGLMAESAAILCGKDRGLKSLEVRIAPEVEMEDQQEGLRQIIDSFYFVANGSNGGQGLEQNFSADNDTNVNQPCEYGIVFHFAKSRSESARKGQPIPNGAYGHADPSLKENLGYRYGAYYRGQRQRMQSLASLLKRFPRLLYFVRGVDVCADELGVPTWVLAPIIKYLKSISRSISAYIKSTEQAHVPPFRTTAHAGEDFQHLLGGLRRVDETIEYFEMSQGDRLGHAIALGINPREWALQTRGVAISRIERLKDLAWEWQFTTQNDINIPASRLQYVLNGIERLSHDVFGVYSRPTHVVAFIGLLHNQDELKILGFPGGSSPPGLTNYVRERFRESHTRQGRTSMGSAYEGSACSETGMQGGGEVKESGSEPWYLLYKYMIDPETFEQGQVQILIDPSREADTLDALQRALRRKVGNLGISVEINPSSNLLIGNMADLKNHPLWRLNPPRQDGTDDVPPVSVCIGSDDPITFSTSTRDEYQLVYDTLTLAGISDFEARVWLDAARKVGLSSRFTFKHDRDAAYIWQPLRVSLDNVPLPP